MKIRRKIEMLALGLIMGSASLMMNTQTIFATSTSIDSMNEPQSQLEKEGLFPSIDKEGNITYIKVKGNDISDELKLPEKKQKDTTFDLRQEFGDGTASTIAKYDTFEEANVALQRRSLFRSTGTYGVYTDDQLRSVTNGVVNFKTKSCEAITLFNEDGTSLSGAINGCYGADAAYLGANTEGTKIKFKMAGVTGWVNKEDVQLLNYDNDNEVKSVSYYEVYNNRIYHNITTNVAVNAYATSIDVGPIQPYMKNGEYYYSYDGHYFYRTYAIMMVDYKNGNYKNAINAGQPYYNYYQYLSFRTTSNYTAANMNNVAASSGGTGSAMLNLGNTYVTYQNTYGVNAGLTFGVSANESAWGWSGYAQNRNNLFGIEAYDSNPDKALTFSSPGESIKKFMQTYVSISYTDPNDVSGLYHGACLGDKSIGMAVKYATAPYWGETNAYYAYVLQKKSGNNSDYGKYTIGIKNTSSTVNIRKEPNTSSTALYRSGGWNNYPFVILDTVTGESVNGNNKWYKIATDAPLSDDRSKVIQYLVDKGGEYNTSVSYAYISATLVDVVSKGSSDNTPQPDPPTPPTPTYKKGDVNGDGYISSKDYNLIKNHITGYKKLSGDVLKRADVNGDGYISSKDYNAIKNHITGYKTLN